MRSIAILLCVLTVTACSAANDWEEFKSSFGKSYDDPEEEKYRKSVFEDNQKTVKEHNDRFEQGLETFDLQINEFGDLTNEEFKSNMNGLKVPTSDATRSRVYHPSNKPIASTVDWRSKGAITEVKNQGQCGSCWAFSTTGSVEAHHFLKTGKLVSLSEQNLMDCSQDFGNLGCMGGLMDSAFKYIKHNKGVDTEASYPYEAKNGICRFNATNVGATDEGYVAIPIFNETALTIAVHDVGPVSVGIDAAGTLFQHYKSGVFYNKNCSDSALDHGVLVVGYGTDSGNDYYIVKNSWGPTWGQEGYIWMSRNKDNNCGIATWASYPIV